MSGAVIPAFIDAALAGRPLPVQGDGLQPRDFTFVDSVTDILARAAVGKVSDMPVKTWRSAAGALFWM